MASLSVIAGIAIVFGTVWLAVGLYTYGPVYRKTLMRLVGRARSPRVFDTGTDRPAADLATIDVLVPAYDERDTIEHSIRAIRAADYPADLLQIHVLVEPADAPTRRALAALDPEYDVTEVVIPSTYPGRRNKPRALNYGFEHTDGDIVGVVDADNIVDPALFRQVVTAILDGDHEYVQAPIDAANESDGLLNTLFRGEYGFWYRTVIPSFFRVGYPVPLGGTSNFATRQLLETAAAEREARFGGLWTPAEEVTLADGGWRGLTPWDPRNVTEDFELGLFLWEMGHRMAMVTATTREESPVGINAWLRQRTRWQKGKLYTLIQRLRSPPSTLRGKLHIYTQSALPHLGPINLLGVLLIAIYATLVGFLAAPMVAAVLLVGLALAIQQMTIHAAGYWRSTDTRGATRAWRTAVTFLTVPGYWALQWAADVRAIIQLAFGHLAWEKTRHTGRHIEAWSTDPTPRTDGLRATITQTDDGWRWAIHRGDIDFAHASQPAPTAAEAARELHRVRDGLRRARGTGSRFEIAATDAGWSWRLTQAGRLMSAGTDRTPTVEATLAAVDTVRHAAGTAALTDPTDPDAGAATAEPDPDSTTS